MVEYGSYDYTEEEVQVLTEWLKNQARQKRIVHYDDAYAVVRHLGAYHGPHDNRLWHLLGLISEREIRDGRHALSAIVTIKSGDGANRPGSGFFELEKALRRYHMDDETTWTAEVIGLFSYWPNH